MAAIGLAAVMVLGITGAIAALGDTLFPGPPWPKDWRRISIRLPAFFCDCAVCIR